MSSRVEPAADGGGDFQATSFEGSCGKSERTCGLPVSDSFRRVVIYSKRESENVDVESDDVGRDFRLDRYLAAMHRALILALLGVAIVGIPSVWSRLIDGMIFHPTPGMDVRPEQLDLVGEDVFLETKDGVRIHGFWLPAKGATRALLFFHGNAGNASHRLPNAAELVALRTSVLLVDYRGYGLSDGTPSEAGVYADAQAALSHLMDERGLPMNRIVVFGRSLGGAVAVDIVQDRDVAGLILESTFPSVAAIARSVLPPAAPFLRGRFDSKSKIARLRAPLLFFHGDRDEIIPFSLGQELFEAAPESKDFERIEGAGHNDTTSVGGRPYFERIRRFLDEVAPS